MGPLAATSFVPVAGVVARPTGARPEAPRLRRQVHSEGRASLTGAGGTRLELLGCSAACGLVASRAFRQSRRRGRGQKPSDRSEDAIAASATAVAAPQRVRFPAPGLVPTTTPQLLHHIFVAAVCVGTPILAPWALPSLPLVLFMFLYADLYSAVLHAALDREECVDVGVLKGAAEGFQMHHDHPMESTGGQGLYRLMCDTVRIQWITGGCGLLTSTRSPLALSIIILKWLFCAYGTQVGHYWSHIPPAKTPGYIKMLQKVRILLPNKHHAEHHLPPYNKNFGIVHGLSNPIMNSLLKDMPLKWLLSLWAFMTIFDIALIERLFAMLA